jgi:hypothetical protein
MRMGFGNKSFHFKYLNGKSVCVVSHRQTDSAMSSGLLKIRDIYLQGRQVKLRDGKTTL